MFTGIFHAAWTGAACCATLGLGLAAFGLALSSAQADETQKVKPADDRSQSAGDAQGLETATFGNGCFWCTEAVFEQAKGVKSVVSGYSGGAIPNPTYKQVSSGVTGHAEAAQITFDPKVISYTELLEIFWKTHDPTTLNRQGPDIGTQYRSVIFYHNAEQKRLAEHYKQKLQESGIYKDPVVTEITEFRAFYRAEAYHQDYYDRNRRQPYCQTVVKPKVEKFKKLFRDKLKTEPDSSQKIKKTDAQWKAQLSGKEFAVTRKKATEPAFSGKYWNHHGVGVYQCVCCGAGLFSSAAKFDSGTGWPSFSAPTEPGLIEEKVDRSHAMVRVEVKCSRCDAHLGHVFSDGPPPGGLRYCINSAALRFEGQQQP